LFFHGTTKFKARHSTSQLVMPHACTHPRFKTCNVTTKFSIISYVIRRIFFSIKHNSKHVAVRLSSSCHTNVHIHISSHSDDKIFQSLHPSVLQHIFFTAIRNSKLVTARIDTSQLVIPHECTHSHFKSYNARKKFQSLHL